MTTDPIAHHYPDRKMRLYHFAWYRRFRRSEQAFAGCVLPVYHFPKLKWYIHKPRSGQVSVPLYHLYQEIRT